MADKPRTWCPQCGPGVPAVWRSDDHGEYLVCLKCVVECTGPGADAALAALEMVRELEVLISAAPDAIADGLFKRSYPPGATCNRLVLETAVHLDGSGWCRNAVRDRVAGALKLLPTPEEANDD